MSIIFTPKIPDHFTKSPKPTIARVNVETPIEKRDRRNSPVQNWTKETITKLAALRVLGVTPSQCSELLGRTISACNKATQYYGLLDDIEEKRAVLIQNVMAPQQPN